MRDENGEIYTVRYEAVNAILLNEFLKEHRKVQEREANHLAAKQGPASDGSASAKADRITYRGPTESGRTA